MGRGITCDIVGEPLRYFKRKNPQVWRAPEGPEGQATVPVGGGEARLRCPWAAARPGYGARGRRRGLAGLRDDAPSEARSADGSRAGRRPRAHQAARPAVPTTTRGRDRFPGHGLVTLGGTQHSATRLADQAVMSTWSSTAARPASRRATGTRNGEQDT